MSVQSFTVNRKLLAEIPHFSSDGGESFFVSDFLQRPGDEFSDHLHLFFFHPTASDRRSAETNAAGNERRTRIERNRVLIDRDAGAIKSFLRYFPGQFSFTQVQQHQMIVGTARD